MFKISPTTKAGRTVYCLNIAKGGSGGKHQRKYFRTQEAARAHRNLLIEETRQHGQELAGLDTETRAALSRWREHFTLAELDALFTKALADRHRLILSNAEASAQYQEARQKRKYSLPAQADVRHRLKVWCKDFGERPMHTIAGGEIEDWIDGLELSETSKKNFRKVLRAFFNYAELRKWVPINPAARVRKFDAEESSPKVLSVEQMKKVMAGADTALRWFLVLGGFMGLRTSETYRVRREHVDLATSELFVDKLKTRQRGMRARYVQISPQARAWMEFLKLPAPGSPLVPVTESRIRVRRTRLVSKLLRLSEWPENCLRDSWASNHLALHENAALTAAQMGHTDAETTFAHYRSPQPKATAAAYFAITPASLKLV